MWRETLRASDTGEKFVAAAGASPFQDRFIAVRYPAANGLSRIFKELHGLLSDVTSKDGRLSDDPGFPGTGF